MSAAIFHKLAEEFGVSPRTVRRVLNAELRDNRPTIVERASRIRQRAAELNYRPNSAAKAVARGRFGSVGLLSSTVPRKSVIGRTFNGIQDACRLANQHLVVGDVPDADLEREGHIPKVLREWAADGLLINYTHGFPASMRTMIIEHGIPSIWINSKLDADCVYPDDFDGALTGARHLLELGHRRIAYTSTFLGPHYSHADRLAGCKAATRQAGVQLQVVAPTVEVDAEEQFLPSWMERFGSPDRPTAVFCYTERDAYGVFAAALLAGLRVPQDVSIVAVSSEQVWAGLRVTTMVLPQYEMGLKSVDMLLRKIRRPTHSLKPLALPHQLTPGATTAPINA